MNIKGYLPTSLIEWPGKIAAVVFVAGCNFRCPFCHNADLADFERSSRLPLIKEKEIFEDLKKRKKWVDGVVVTGGEPTLQPDLNRFLSRCKRIGLATMIETNGSRPKLLEKLFNESLLDFVAMDVKGPLNQQYLRIIGSQNSKVKSQSCNLKVKTLEDVKRSVHLILNSGGDFEFRTTVVPGIHDKKNMVKLAKELKKIFTNHQSPTTNHLSWFLQNFQPQNCLNPTFNKLKPYSPKEMEEILVAVGRYVPGAELRGT